MPDNAPKAPDADPNPDLTRLKDCRYGKMLYLWRDEYVGRSLDVYGEFSEGEADIFRKLVHPNDVVIEVGANIGAHTVLFAKQAGPQGLVIAFEPQRTLFHILCANVALNNLFNVHAYLAAVGKEQGSLKVPPIDYSAEANFGGLPLGDGDISAGETVPLAALDFLTLPYLRLIKIDVEGMEADVLRGAQNLISKHRPFLYVENDRREKSKELIGLIDSLGYDMWWHLPPLFNPDNFAHNGQNIFENTVSTNLLCIPKEHSADIGDLRKVSGPDDFCR